MLQPDRHLNTPGSERGNKLFYVVYPSACPSCGEQGKQVMEDCRINRDTLEPSLQLKPLVKGLAHCSDGLMDYNTLIQLIVGPALQIC